MKKLTKFAGTLLVAAFTLGFSMETVAAPTNTIAAQQIEELNPFDPNIEAQLEEFDRVYEETTGLSPFLEQDPFDVFNMMSSCYRASCKIWVQIVKSTQTGYLYINGALVNSFKVSTGIKGYSTPNFDKNPNGRIYTKYSSNKYPGGDYNGLGNMPYAVFIHGGFALHGTPRGNWPKLGRVASHGCIRMLPENAQSINSLIRSHGIYNTWITVQN